MNLQRCCSGWAERVERLSVMAHWRWLYCCLRQVFTERGFVTRVLMASFDLSKLTKLDEQITKVLNDMAVSVALARAFGHTSIAVMTTLELQQTGHGRYMVWQVALQVSTLQCQRTAYSKLAADNELILAKLAELQGNAAKGDGVTGNGVRQRCHSWNSQSDIDLAQL